MRGNGGLFARRFTSVEDGDFMFENKMVRVVANRDEAKIKLAGFSVGPFDEGKEYEVRFWIAQILERNGVVRLQSEGLLDVVSLHKIHWKERVQPPNKVSSLPEEFYPKLRRCLADLKEASKVSSEKLKEYDKSLRISHDIVNCRVKKIVSLSSHPPLTAQALQSLSGEEKMLYHRLHSIIHDWKTKIFGVGRESDDRS